MKYIIILLFALLLTNCTPIKSSDFPDKSELRRFKVVSQNEKPADASLFFAIGSYHSSDKTINTINFYCKNKNGEYCAFKVLPKNVRISLDSTVTTPYVRIFTEYDGYSSFNTLQSRLTDDYQTWATYVTIVCAPKDFPESIDLTQL